MLKQKKNDLWNSLIAHPLIAASTVGHNGQSESNIVAEIPGFSVGRNYLPAKYLDTRPRVSRKHNHSAHRKVFYFAVFLMIRMSGAILISIQDTRQSLSAVNSSLWGDFLALLSAFFYALCTSCLWSSLFVFNQKIPSLALLPANDPALHPA